MGTPRIGSREGWLGETPLISPWGDHCWLGVLFHPPGRAPVVTAAPLLPSPQHTYTRKGRTDTRTTRPRPWLRDRAPACYHLCAWPRGSRERPWQNRRPLRQLGPYCGYRGSHSFQGSLRPWRHGAHSASQRKGCCFLLATYSAPSTSKLLVPDR